jgi:diaminopimelate decarboxylase
MASNYNKAPIPAVVFIENGKSKLVVKKQSYKEIIEREV